MLRVTFDTNVLDLACRPERFPGHPLQPALGRVRDALAAQRIQGFYPVTMLTIEGIMKADRADVFSDTRLEPQPESSSRVPTSTLPDALRQTVGADDIERIEMTLQVTQPGRKPLHPEVVARAKAAHALGIRALKDVPRIGAFKYEDPDGTFYTPLDAGQSLDEWINRTYDIVRAVEARGVGMAQVKALGISLASGDPQKVWFAALDQAADIHAQRAVERAFSEWADADALASHIAYGFDIFCSADVGNSNATNSVLDPTNRAWLTATYGTRFMTFDDLLQHLP